LSLGQQESQKIYRVFKFMYTLPSDFLPELGAQFREFFKYHNNKVIKLWHDPANNQWQSVGEDHASKMKKAIEYDSDGNGTGWTVQLMNRERGSILQVTEYELMLQMLVENNTAGLPMIMIDKNECAPLVASMQKAEMLIRTDRKGVKSIHKNKSSESLPDDMLPFYSTNPSDSAKYLFARLEYLDEIAGENVSFGGDPSIH
jgi:hypothetical protein